MSLLAQIGLQTEFKSSKSSSGNNNSRTKKFQDLDIIFDSIRGHLLDLLSSDNDLIEQWVTRERVQSNRVGRSTVTTFCVHLLTSEVINEETKDRVRSLLADEQLRNDNGVDNGGK